MGELLEEQINRFIPFGQDVVLGLPSYLHDIELDHIMYAGEGHMLTLMRAGLNGKRHGDQSLDADKYFVPNAGTLRQVNYLRSSGLWTTDPNLVLPDPESIDDSRPLGTLITNLADEKLMLGKGEKDAHTVVMVDATVDGAIKRINTVNAVLEAGVNPDRIVALSGLRKVRPDEGNSGRWKNYTGNTDGTVQEAFPTNYSATNAILQAELTGLELTSVLEDDGPDAHLRQNEKARIYSYKNPQTGKDIEVIVMNGMPKVQPNAVNRSTTDAEPSAPDTFQEYLETFDIKPGHMSYISSYPHRNRIAIEGLMRLADLHMADEVWLHPQGMMTWPDKITGGIMAGEVEPMMRLTRQLLDKAGISQDRIPRTGPIVESYLRHNR